MQKSLIFDQKSNSEGTSILFFQNLLINIGQHNSKSKHTNLIYKSQCTTFN
jgi:hypothetical protein